MTENEDGYRYSLTRWSLLPQQATHNRRSEEGLNTSSNQLFGFHTAKLPIYSHYKNYL